MTGTPRSNATSELETQPEGNNSSASSLSSANAAAAAAAAPTTTTGATETKQPVILVSAAGNFTPRETHWAITEWLARSTTAATIERAWSERAKNAIRPTAAATIATATATIATAAATIERAWSEPAKNATSGSDSSRNPSPSAGSRQ